MSALWRCILLEADDLAGALSKATLHPDADLLLLDLHLPGMQGASSIREVAQIHPQLPLLTRLVNVWLSSRFEIDRTHEVKTAYGLGRMVNDIGCYCRSGMDHVKPVVPTTVWGDCVIKVVEYRRQS